MTGQPPIILQELDLAGQVHCLDDAQAALLAVTRLVDVQPLGSGRWRLLPAGRVGAVRAGDLDVQVRPKTGIARLLFLLGYAADPGFRSDDVTASAEPDLWPALAESVVRQTERALGPGVLQGYVVVDEALPLVRGRVRVADQIARRPGLPLPLEVRYDEYAPDIPENQIIRSALRRLAAVPRLRPDLQSRLAHLDGRLDGVHVLAPRSALPEWRLTRLNSRYTAALRLAEIVLRNQSAEPGPGGVTVASFVVSMAKVFEDFVTVALQEALAASPGHTQGQYPDFLAEQRQVPIRPDVVHLMGSRPVAVFDAKYKLEDPSSGYRTRTLTRCWPTALLCNSVAGGWSTHRADRPVRGEYETRRSRSSSTRSTSPRRPRIYCASWPRSPARQSQEARVDLHGSSSRRTSSAGDGQFYSAGMAGRAPFAARCEH